MVHHAARMRLESTVCFPAPGLTRHLWAGLPLASARGRGADAGSFVPQERTASPHTFTVCLFLLLRAGPLLPASSSSDHGSPCCTDEAGTSSLSRRSGFPRRRMDAPAPRQPDTSGVNNIYLHSINKEETPLGGGRRRCFRRLLSVCSFPDAAIIAFRRIQARQKRRPP